MTSTINLNANSRLRVNNFLASIYEILYPDHGGQDVLLSTADIMKATNVAEFICHCMEQPPLSPEEIKAVLNLAQGSPNCSENDLNKNASPKEKDYE